MIGAGAVLLRTDAFGRQAAAIPALPAAVSSTRKIETGPIEWSEGKGMAEDAGGAPDAAADVELPVTRETQALSQDPDIRAEAAALRVAMDGEQAGGD